MVSKGAPGGLGKLKCHRWLVAAGEKWISIAPDEDAPLEDRVGVWIYPRVIDIHWDVNLVAPEALMAAVDWMERADAAPALHTALRFNFGAWATELYEHPLRAAQRIREIATFAGSEPFGGMTRKRLSLARAYDGGRDTVNLVDTWLRLGGYMMPNESEMLTALIPKTLIFRHVANDNAFIYALAGRESHMARTMGDGWSSSVLGRRAEDCWSDDRYEQEVCADYGPVMDRDEGRYDHFHAVMDLPGREPIWVSYERLSLPWITISGERILMVFTAPSQNLDIPFLSTG
ncbi:MAG: hypothetical protein RIC16_15585 [Rhodospirillales bacterium]